MFRCVFLSVSVCVSECIRVCFSVLPCVNLNVSVCVTYGLRESSVSQESMTWRESETMGRDNISENASKSNSTRRKPKRSKR